MDALLVEGIGRRESYRPAGPPRYRVPTCDEIAFKYS
jgi:hypothetical protein